MFSCHYCGFNGETATVEDSDAESFVTRLLHLVAEKLYHVRLLIQTARHGSIVVIHVRPHGSMVPGRRRAWGRLRDEMLTSTVRASGIIIAPQIVERAWDKWPMLTLCARIAGDVPVECSPAQS